MLRDLLRGGGPPRREGVDERAAKGHLELRAQEGGQGRGPGGAREQQAAKEGWIYVSPAKTIRGWNLIWVEGAREGRGELGETAQRPYTPLCDPRV